MAWKALRGMNPYPDLSLVDPPTSPPKNNLCITPVIPNDFLSYANRNTSVHRDRHRESVSSSSGSSVCEPTSPVGGHRSSDPSPAITLHADGDAEDAPWNLVAYHIPWGPGYEGYDAGTLPGPDGVCIFLRSPTPLKRQRTSQACEKCRERKAKCSGARPSCARCLDRGLRCLYGVSPSHEMQPFPSRSTLRRPSESGSSTLVRHPQLKVSRRKGVRRKSSVADSELSLGSGTWYEEGSDSKARSYSAVVGAEFPKDWNEGSMGKYSRLSVFGDDFESPTELLTESASLSFNASPNIDFPGHDLSVPLDHRGHTFPWSGDTSTPLYAYSLSGLNAYRFPPKEDVKDISLSQSEPQIPCFPGSMYSLPASSMDPPDNSLHMASISMSSELGMIWNSSECFSTRSEAPLAFRELLPSTSNKPNLSDPQFQSRTFANAIPDQTSEQYSAAVAPFSHSYPLQYGFNAVKDL